MTEDEPNGYDYIESTETKVEEVAEAATEDIIESSKYKTSKPYRITIKARVVK